MTKRDARADRAKARVRRVAILVASASTKLEPTKDYVTRFYKAVSQR